MKIINEIDRIICIYCQQVTIYFILFFLTLDTTCNPNQCVNGDCKYNTTIVNGTKYYFQYCQCRSGFYGSLCQHISVCDSNPCMNGGTCTNMHSTFPSNYYTCQCASSYFGIHCEYGMIYVNDCIVHQ